MLLGSWTVTAFVLANVGTLALAIWVYAWREWVRSRSAAGGEGDRSGASRSE